MGRGMNGRIAVPVLALLLGLGLGAWGMRLAFDRTVRRWDPRQQLVVELTAELDLDPAQQAQVAVILAGQKARMEQGRRAWEDAVGVLGRQGEDAIAAILNARQATRFSALHDRIHGSVERYLWASEAPSTAVAGAGR